MDIYLPLQRAKQELDKLLRCSDAKSNISGKQPDSDLMSQKSHTKKDNRDVTSSADHFLKQKNKIGLIAFQRKED